MIAEVNRKFIGVMYKDPRFTETGGWGYDEFEGNTEVRAKNKSTHMLQLSPKS